MASLLPFCLLLFVSIASVITTPCSAIAFGAKRKTTLVLVDSPKIQESHSEFFQILKNRGFDLAFKSAKDKNLSFKKYGEFHYDNLILFAPNTENIPGINEHVLREYADSGGNIMIASDSRLPETLRVFATDVGVEYDDDENFVIDHFHYDTALDDGQHNVVISENFLQNPVVLGHDALSPVLFRGPGMKLGSNRFLLPIVRGSSTAYSANPDDQDIHVAGEAVTLVAGLQARNGARVTFLGSLEMLSNRFFNAHVSRSNAGKTPTDVGASGNRQLAQELVVWAFQERGVLRHRNMHHHLKGMNETAYTYRVNEDMVFSVDIEEWNGQEWIGFSADDVQLEFIMLDPWLRLPLEHQGNGRYVCEFKIPDVYGVYKFHVHYQRPGYSPLVFSEQVAIRPYRMNEFERFLDMAYPYYGSTLSLLVGFFVFSFIFLYTPADL